MTEEMAKSILVTGGLGYVGSHILAQATNHVGDETEVRILDNLSSGNVNILHDLPEGPRFRFIEGDILDPDSLDRAVDGVDTVLHLAGMVRSPYTFSMPPSVTQVNTWGTAQLVERCLDKVERFVFASTASVYGVGESFKEGDKCKPLGPYAHSKLEAEERVRAGAKRGLSATILRLGTVFGGQGASVRYDSVPNKLTYKAATGEVLPVPGSGTQTRPYLHADDAADALWHSLGGRLEDATYNVAAYNLSINDIVTELSDIWDGPDIRYTDQDYRQHISLSVDPERFQDTGWSPQVEFPEGLSQFAERFLLLGGTSGKDGLDWQEHLQA